MCGEVVVVVVVVVCVGGGGERSHGRAGDRVTDGSNALKVGKEQVGGGGAEGRHAWACTRMPAGNHARSLPAICSGRRPSATLWALPGWSVAFSSLDAPAGSFAGYLLPTVHVSPPPRHSRASPALVCCAAR